MGCGNAAAGPRDAPEGCGACGTLAHLRPPQPALPLKMAADAGRAQARGGCAGLGTGAPPHQSPEWVGGAMGGANRGLRPPPVPGDGAGPGQSRLSAAHPALPHREQPPKGVRELPLLPELPRHPQGAGAFLQACSPHCGLTTSEVTDQGEYRDRHALPDLLWGFCPIPAGLPGHTQVVNVSPI